MCLSACVVPKCVFECEAHSSVSVLELQEQQGICWVQVKKGQLHPGTLILHRSICDRKKQSSVSNLGNSKRIQSDHHVSTSNTDSCSLRGSLTDLLGRNAFYLEK